MIELAQQIDRAWLNKQFDRLALAVPSRMLGELRAVLSEPARAAILVEIAKDLTKIPDAEIADHLAPILRDAAQQEACRTMAE